MADKAYIVANEEQEIKILMEFERRGYRWINTNENPISNGSLVGRELEDYPLFIGERIETKTIYWQDINQLTNEEIVYDGRKESKMKISKEVYDALVEWKKLRHPGNNSINAFDLMELSRKDEKWWQGIDTTKTTNTNNWLIALIRWASGEDVFAVEKPKQWIVQSKEIDDDNEHGYVYMNAYGLVFNTYHIQDATKFDTKEEAESWANSHQEVVEVE